MPYCTQSDVLLQLDETKLISLTDDYGTGDVDSDVVDRAIADADEEIDAYIGVRYSLPFDSVPNRIRSCSVEIAIYNLFSRRRTAPEEREKRYERAIAFLKDVAAGKAVLDVPDPANDSDQGVDISVVKGDRIFSRGRDSDSSSGTLDNY